MNRASTACKNAISLCKNSTTSRSELLPDLALSQSPKRSLRLAVLFRNQARTTARSTVPELHRKNRIDSCLTGAYHCRQR